ncbi:hypothetical protein MTR67_013919 [Solanum verrucosum]|uniref:Uncharacterized protein n=1 Tax=Solanum verrucosum TaxID=315347 RepID=A0AAF0QBA4_SOLVR|nr:hypothetical protein MTR67_013919 [Solanum verrucosum]
MLQSPFEEQEIWFSVQECAGDKAPGPDGFTMAFFKHCWEVANTEVIATIQNFHERDIFERSFNATYVALIPKKAPHNWNKSFLYPVDEVPDIHNLANILGGRTGVLPTIYLGMPLGAKSNSKDIWNGVIEKSKKKLINWKRHYLSLGNRLIVINSVLDALKLI